MARREPKHAFAVAAAVGLIIVVGVVIPLVIARHYDATGIPRDDDWSYFRALFHWVDTGQLDFNHWVSMILLGQLVLAAPVVLVFGNDITPVQVLTVCIGLVGLLSVLWLGVLMTRRLWVATFVAVLVAAGPLWGALSVSFMTDVPAFALSLIACTLGARAFVARQVALGYLVAALVASFAGFTIRQYAAVPMLAIVIIGAWALLREGRGRRFWILAGVTVAVVVASVAVLLFWRTIPNIKPFTPGAPDSHSIRATFYKGSGLVRLLGLLLAPVVVLVGPVHILKRAWNAASATTVGVGFVVAAVLGYTAVEAPRIAFAGNFVLPNGILGDGVIGGNRPDILPSGMWPLLVAIGTASAFLLVLAVVPALAALGRRIRDRDLTLAEPMVALLGLVVFGYFSAYLLACLSGLPMADRYLLPILPLTALLLVRSERPSAVAPIPVGSPAEMANGVLAASTRPYERTRLVSAGLGLALILAVGIVFSVDSASFDGTRWKVAEAATRFGYGPNQVRGGFEWTNFHERGDKSRVPVCVTVIVDPPRGTDPDDVVASLDYDSPFIDPVPIVAIRGNKDCTPAGRPVADP